MNTTDKLAERVSQRHLYLFSRDPAFIHASSVISTTCRRQRLNACKNDVHVSWKGDFIDRAASLLKRGTVARPTLIWSSCCA